MGRSRLTQPLPWYQWNPTQWQGSRKVQRMTWAQRGLYRELIDECWIKGSVPSTVNGIAEMFGVDEPEITPLLPQILKCFDLHEDETMTSPFIEEARAEADAFRLSQANRRLGKTKNGEPRLTTVNQTEPKITEPNQAEAIQYNTEQYRTEQYRTEQKEPPTPFGAGKPRAPSWKASLPEGVVECTARIMEIWPNPKRGDIQPDTKNTTPVPASSGPELARRLDAIHRQGGDLAVCEVIAARAVQEWRDGQWIKAAQNFFGKAKDAPFQAYYQAHVTNQALEVGAA